VRDSIPLKIIGQHIGPFHISNLVRLPRSAGKTFFWYEFKSAAKDFQVMYQPMFCGESGPRTIFTIDACQSYMIQPFSQFPTVGLSLSLYLSLSLSLSLFSRARALARALSPSHSLFLSPDRPSIRCSVEQVRCSGLSF